MNVSSQMIWCLVAAICSKQSPGVTLIKTRFHGMNCQGERTKSFLIDVSSISLRVLETSITKVESAGAICGCLSSNLYVERSTFSDVRGSPVVASADQNFDPGTYSGSYSKRARTSTGTVTFVDAHFEDITSQNPFTGGAIYASGGDMLNLTQTTFVKCQTGGTGSSGGTGWGGAVFCKAKQFVFDYCIVEQCTSLHSIVHFEQFTVTSATITGSQFKTVSVTATPENSWESGGCGLVVKDIENLQLVDCQFTGCRRENIDGGCFATYKVKEGGTLEMNGCTFTDTKAPNGGCIYVHQPLNSLMAIDCTFTRSTTPGTGGVFHFYTSERTKATPQKFVIQGCTIEGASAQYGCLVGGLSTVQVPSFVVQNTKIVDCKVTANSGARWLNMKAVQCVFDNITITNMPAYSDGSMIYLEVSNETIELHDCTFESVKAFNFLIDYGGPRKTSLVLKNCRLSEIRTDNALNKLDSSPIPVTLEWCQVNGVSTTATSWIDYTGSGTGSNPAVTVANCEFSNVQVESGKWLFHLWQAGLSMTDCDFKGARGPLISIQSGNGLTMTISRVTMSDCSGTFGTFEGGNIVIDELNLTKSTCSITAGSKTPCQKFSLKNSEQSAMSLTVTSEAIELVNTKMAAADSSPTVSLTGTGEADQTIQGCTFDFGITVEAGTFAFSDCCFQGAGDSVHYISSTGAKSLKFEAPICFDKTKEAALSIGSITEDSDSTMFNCKQCGVIVYPTSEAEETSDLPFETSEDMADTSVFPEPEEATSASADSGVFPDPGEDTSDVTSQGDTEPGPVVTGDGDPSKAGSGLSAGVIAAIAIVVIIVVIVAVLLIVLFVIRKKRQNSSHEDDGDEMFEEDSSVTTETIATDSIGDAAATTSPLFSVSMEGEEFSDCFEETMVT